MQPSSFLLLTLLAFSRLPATAGPHSAAGPHSPAAVGDGKTIIPSTLRSATVYRNGAELVHTATAHLQKGNNELIIGDVSNAIDPSTIRVACSTNLTILSAAVSTDHLRPEPANPFIRKLQDSIAGIKKELTRLDIQIRSDNDLLDLLDKNKKIGSPTAGTNLTELAKTLDYYRQKGLELRTELSGYNERSQQLKDITARLDRQIAEEQLKGVSPGGNLVLQIMSPAAGPCDLTISYLTMAAFWVPAYDLKVENSTDSLHLFYKARVTQASGIDWKQVKLSLSTSLPAQDGNAPVLQTLFLQFAEPVVLGYATQSFSYSNRISADKPNAYIIKKDTVSYLAEDRLKQLPTVAIDVNERQMDAVFDIDIPYDIPDNGKEQNVVLKDYQIPCAYQYYSAPGVDHDAWLLGQLTGWEKLNLLPGEASIMVDGTYIGRSHVDAGSIQDTLNLTLGRDKRIVVKKEKITDYSSIKFLGSNKKQVFAWQITVRNNKKTKTRLLLKDQYPISTNKDIEEELLESSGATVNNNTGVLTWNVELVPGESRSYRFSYSVKYPKDKVLNIN